MEVYRPQPLASRCRSTATKLLPWGSFKHADGGMPVEGPSSEGASMEGIPMGSASALHDVTSPTPILDNVCACLA